MAYPGPNRRVHTVFMTQKTEYHVCANLCVAVRDRKTRVWSALHDVVGMVLKTPINGQPIVGGCLTFCSEQFSIRTPKIVDIIRPGRRTVATYQLVWSTSPAEFSWESSPSPNSSGLQN
jgi:hypothetical protein